MAEVQEAEIHDLAAHRLERYDGIGEALRLTRLQGGLTLEAVAGALRIRYVNLLAIEEGRFDDLPGQAYVSGFVRAYAEYLGLDGEEVLRRFREETSNKSNAQDLHFPEPPSDGWMPRSAVVTVSVVLAVVVFGGWYILSRGGQSTGNLVAEVPGVIERAAKSVGALTGSLTRDVTNDIVGVLTNDPAGDSVAEPRATNGPGRLATGEKTRDLIALTEAPDLPVSVPPPSQTSTPQTSPSLTSTSPAATSPTGEIRTGPTGEIRTGTVPATGNTAISAPVAVPSLDVPARELADRGATAPGVLAEPARQNPAVNGPALSGPRNLRGGATSGMALTAPDPQQIAPENLALALENSTPANITAEKLTVESARATTQTASQSGLDVARRVAAPIDDAENTRAAKPPAAEPQNESIAISSALAALPNTPSASSTPSSRALVPPPPPLSASTDSPRIYGQENTNFRVLIRAIEDSWVQVQSFDNELLITRILKSGDVYRVPDRDDIVLSTGNAGGLEIIVDGIALPPLGQRGVVRRDVMLDPTALRAGPTARQAEGGNEG